MHTHNKFDHMVFALEATMTENDLIEMARMYICIPDFSQVLFSVSGYDQDSRELYQIPEVIAFFKRMIKVGFTALFKQDVPGSDDALGLRAVHVWGWGHKEFKSLTFDVNLLDFKLFQVQQLVRLEHHTAPHDGQNRTKGGILQ